MKRDLESDVSNCFCLNLRRAARKVTQAYDVALQSSGLKITQFSLLSAIAKMEKTTVVPLAEFLGMDRTTLTRNLSILARDGLLTVQQGSEDHREQWVALTKSGNLALTKAQPLWRAAQATQLHQVGSSMAETLLAHLDRLK